MRPNLDGGRGRRGDALSQRPDCLLPAKARPQYREQDTKTILDGTQLTGAVSSMSFDTRHLGDAEASPERPNIYFSLYLEAVSTQVQPVDSATSECEVAVTQVALA